MTKTDDIDVDADQQPRKKARTNAAGTTSKIPVLPSSTTAQKADAASASTTTTASTTSSTPQFAFGARIVKEPKARLSKDSKSKESGKESLPKRPSNPAVAAPKDDVKDAMSEKRAALLKQSNEFMEMAENCKLKAEIELLQSVIAQHEERDKKRTARSKMQSGVMKAQQDQIKDLQDEIKKLQDDHKKATDREQDAAAKLKEALVAQDRLKDKLAKAEASQSERCACGGVTTGVPNAVTRPAIQERRAAIADGLKQADEIEALLREFLLQMVKEG